MWKWQITPSLLEETVPFRLRKKGMLIQPEFYMMKLYADHLGDSLLESWNDVEKVTIDMPVDHRWPKYGMIQKKERQIPLLDVAVTRATDDSVTAFVTNVSPDQEMEALLELKECRRTYKRLAVSTLSGIRICMQITRRIRMR